MSIAETKIEVHPSTQEVLSEKPSVENSSKSYKVALVILGAVVLAPVTLGISLLVVAGWLVYKFYCKKSETIGLQTISPIPKIPVNEPEKRHNNVHVVGKSLDSGVIEQPIICSPSKKKEGIVEDSQADLDWMSSLTVSYKTISNNDFQKFSDLAKCNANKINQRDEKFSRTILHRCALRGDKNRILVSVLAENGIDFSLQDHLFRNTPLIWAVANANNGIAEEIIKCSPEESLNVKSHSGNTAMHLIVGKGYEKFSKDGDLLACSNYALLEGIIAKGADVNVQNKAGYTPLHLACIRRDRQMIDLLLKNGADLNILDKKGQKPFDLIALSYQEACKIIESTVAVYLLDEENFKKTHRGFPDGS